MDRQEDLSLRPEPPNFIAQRSGDPSISPFRFRGGPPPHKLPRQITPGLPPLQQTAAQLRTQPGADFSRPPETPFVETAIHNATMKDKLLEYLENTLIGVTGNAVAEDGVNDSTILSGSLAAYLLSR